MRSHVTLQTNIHARFHARGFNTASGMRSHVTRRRRRRYAYPHEEFQYRKRYEVTCDSEDAYPEGIQQTVSIPQAV